MFKPFVYKTLEYTDTVNGRLRGYKMEGVYNFLGIPYGECKRWQTATPAKPWKGIRNALQFGARMFPGAAGNPNVPNFTPWDSCGVAHEAYDYAEDALNLNIWTPSLEKTAKKPVMVWIHGGGYSTGSAMEMQGHDGNALAKFGDVVVVGVNHRLNVFGFLDVSRFGEKYKNSGNCGLSDLVLALQWVRENIENFGGDPENVLIFGQSGGGGKVSALLQIPAAAGLFHKTIIMSGIARHGGPGNGAEDDSTSRKVLDALLEKFGTDSIETLEDLTPEELLEAVQAITPIVGGRSVPGGRIPSIGWHPIANDWYPGSMLTVGISEHAKKIPVMLGSTISEFPMMRIINKHAYTKEEQIAIVKEAFPNQDADKLIELFVQAWPDKCITDVIEMTGHMDFRPGTIDYADMRAKEACAPTYMYMFSHDFPQEGGRGAWHCADIPIVFHNAEMYPENFKDGLLDGLQDAMSASWAGFAHHGNPNNAYLTLNWPEYKTGECACFIFDDQMSVRNDFDRELMKYKENLELRISTKYTEFKQVIN